jgi:hypothetical protein
VRYDRATRSWRTAQSSLLGGSDVFSGIWPRWGSMLAGVCSELPMSARLTSETASGSLLPTPVASTSGYNRGGGQGRVGPIRPSLLMMARKDMWPTPVSADCGRGSGMYARGNLTLMGAVKETFQTPTAQDANGRDRHNQRDGSVTLSLLGQCRAWPTPRSSDGTHGGRVTERKSREGGNLIEAVAAEMFITPTSEDAKRAGPKETEMMRIYEAGQNVPDTYKRLRSQVAARESFPTPMARDGDPKRGMPSQEAATARLASGRRNLEDSIAASGPAAGGRVLNPDWVELLMGWPKGWTAVPPGKPAGKTARREPSGRKTSATGRGASRRSETDRSLNVSRSPGGC